MVSAPFLRRREYALSKETEARLVDQVVSAVEKRHLWRIAIRILVVLLGFFGLIGVTLWQSVDSLNRYIEAQFQTPRIERIIDDVATRHAQNLLESSVEPQVDQFRTELRLIGEDAKTQSRAFQDRLGVFEVEL